MSSEGSGRTGRSDGNAFAKLRKFNIDDDDDDDPLHAAGLTIPIVIISLNILNTKLVLKGPAISSLSEFQEGKENTKLSAHFAL